MTGITTDIGVIIGHQLGRWLHDLAMRAQMVPPDSAEKLKATRSEQLKEWTQLKLLSLLLVSFFFGGVLGFAMFRALGADALVLPAITEAAMGLEYFLYRTWLQPLEADNGLETRRGRLFWVGANARRPVEPAAASDARV